MTTSSDHPEPHTVGDLIRERIRLLEEEGLGDSPAGRALHDALNRLKSDKVKYTGAILHTKPD